MSGSTTPNYNFALPTVSGDQNVWGNKLNSNWSSLDTLLKTLTSPTGAYLPLTGGSLSGSLTVAGTLQTSATLGVTGLAAFAYPTVTDFLIQRTGGYREVHFSNSDQLVWSESNSYFSFVHGSTVTLSIDPSGNLAINGGNAYKVGGSASWIVTSDERMKRNLRPYETGLAAVCALRPAKFEYNGQGGTTDDGVTQYGLSAQATQPVMPEMVREMPQGHLGTDTGPLLLAVVNAVRELAGRVEALEGDRG